MKKRTRWGSHKDHFMRQYTDKNCNKNDLKKKGNCIEPITLLRKPSDESLTHGISKCGHVGYRY